MPVVLENGKLRSKAGKPAKLYNNYKQCCDSGYIARLTVTFPEEMRYGARKLWMGRYWCYPHDDGAVKDVCLDHSSSESFTPDDIETVDEYGNFFNKFYDSQLTIRNEVISGPGLFLKKNVHLKDGRGSQSTGYAPDENGNQFVTHFFFNEIDKKIYLTIESAHRDIRQVYKKYKFVSVNATGYGPLPGLYPPLVNPNPYPETHYTARRSGGYGGPQWIKRHPTEDGDPTGTSGPPIQEHPSFGAEFFNGHSFNTTDEDGFDYSFELLIEGNE